MIASRQRISGWLAAGVTIALAACAPKAPPPPPPPPPAPVPVVVIPPRPTPPNGAAPTLVVPPMGANGVRQTVNASISTAQTTWNLRSAYNVAALNCLAPQHAEILIGYRAFLRTHARALTAANRAVDSEFRARHGSRFIAPREAYMTQVYNYFAFPPTLDAFCDAALVMSREGQAISPREMDAFAARSLPQLEAVFDSFFRRYEQYRIDLASWDAQYSSISAAGTATAQHR